MFVYFFVLGEKHSENRFTTEKNAGNKKPCESFLYCLFIQLIVVCIVFNQIIYVHTCNKRQKTLTCICFLFIFLIWNHLHSIEILLSGSVYANNGKKGKSQISSVKKINQKHTIKCNLKKNIARLIRNWVLIL